MTPNELVEIVDCVVKSKHEFKTEETSVPQSIIRKLIEKGNNEAMIDCETDTKWTAKDMIEAITNLAVKFHEFGVRKNDVVAFCCANSDIHTLALLTVWCIGAVYTASLPTSPLRELRNVVLDSGATFFVCAQENIEIAEQLVNDLKIIKKLFIINGNHERCVSIRSLLKQKSKESKEQWFFEQLSAIKSSDLLKVNFSSGTTGKPKATSQKNRNLLAVTAASAPGFEFILSEDIVPIVSHYSHTGGTLVLALALLQGATIAVVSKFESNSFVNYVQKYNFSAAMMVPSSINLMAKTVKNPIDNFPLKKVLCTGEFLSRKVATEFIRIFKPLYLGQSFGSTEMGFALVKPISDGTEKVQSIGVPTPGVEVKIVDLVGNKNLGPNCVGEIRLTGPQVTEGYLNNDQANNESFDEDGYLKTGDLGYYTNDVYFYFADRYKEVIKFGGLQVSPTELEGILLEHESVKEAAVVGVPDEVWGQLPKAFVSLKDDFKSKVTSEELLQFANSQVADYKQLKAGLIIVPEITKSVLGKIDKKALKYK